MCVCVSARARERVCVCICVFPGYVFFNQLCLTDFPLIYDFTENIYFIRLFVHLFDDDVCVCVCVLYALTLKNMYI